MSSWGMPSNFNTFLFSLINDGAGYYTVLDFIFVLLTSYIMYTVFFVLAIYIGMYTPLKMPKGPLRYQSLIRAIEITLALVSTWVITKVIKIIIAHPRPFEVFSDITVLAPIEGGTSFPSGHSSLTMALATAVYFYYPRLGKLLFAFAFVVGLSRIFVGVHYPLDVGAGLLLGYIVAKGIHTLLQFVKIAPGAKKG